MPAAARMMCSSCGLCIALADGGLDGPDFGGREHAGKRRVLAQASSLLGVGTQDLADVIERTFENGQPFAVAMDEARSACLLTQPAGDIVESDFQQGGLFAEPGGDTPTHLQADCIAHLVLYGQEVSRRAGGKEEGWSRLRFPLPSKFVLRRSMRGAGTLNIQRRTPNAERRRQRLWFGSMCDEKVVAYPAPGAPNSDSARSPPF